MDDTDPLEELRVQITQIKAALRSILQLDQRISSSDDSLDPKVAAAITDSFNEHMPGFNYEQQRNTPDAKSSMDIAVKQVLAELVCTASEAEQHVMMFHTTGAMLPSVPQLLDLARYLAHIALADQTLFLQLITDLVETCTINEGAEIFLYLEKCVPFMKAKFNFESMSSSPKLAVLRICNQLLRRLSRAHHVVLAGRIHIFLSQILPSTDRSAVNANGQVNESHAIDIEDVSEGALNTDGKPVNVTFYKQFWSLQQVFQNPTKAADPNLWLQVYANIKAVLAEFAKVRPTVAAGSINSSVAGTDGEQEGLTVKYLSSPKLLHLQLRDAGFRRHFLVQCLALLQACSRKSLTRQEVFRIKQQGEADDLQDLLYKELERTPQHGAQFARAIRALMHHEDQWADWKAEGARSFERPERPLSTAQPPAKRRRITRPEVVNMGTRELSRLWNLTTANHSAIQIANRRHVPTVREFLDPVVQEMDPEEGIEEQYKRMKDPVYRWEALRQIAKESRVTLSDTVKTKDQNLEKAVQLLYPDDVPAGAQKPPEANPSLAEAAEFGPPPSPGPALLDETADTHSAGAAKSEEEGELQADEPAPAHVPVAGGDVEMADVQLERRDAAKAAEQTLEPDLEPDAQNARGAHVAEAFENGSKGDTAVGLLVTENGQAENIPAQQTASVTEDTGAGSVTQRGGEDGEAPQQSGGELIRQGKESLVLQEGKMLSVGDSHLSSGAGSTDLSEMQKPG